MLTQHFVREDFPPCGRPLHSCNMWAMYQFFFSEQNLIMMLFDGLFIYLTNPSSLLLFISPFTAKSMPWHSVLRHACSYSYQHFFSANNPHTGSSSPQTHTDWQLRYRYTLYSKTCLKRNTIVRIFFPRFHRFPFYKGLCFNKTKYKKYDRLGLQWRNNLK